MKEEKMKPCPWCGNSGMVVFEPIRGYNGNHFYYVKCFKCEATAPKEYKFNDIYQTSEQAVEKAIKAWNKREN